MIQADLRTGIPMADRNPPSIGMPALGRFLRISLRRWH